MKKAMLPIGICNFRELVTHRDSEENSYLFVDKSLLIRDFIDAGDKITLITRPRRFGKTLNLSMLQHFFAKEVGGKSTKGLFDSLEISKHPNIMAYQDQYPVIFLTLKGIRGRSFEVAFNRIKAVVKELFQDHRYLLNHNLADEDVIFFRRYSTKKLHKPNMKLLFTTFADFCIIIQVKRSLSC